MYNNDFFALYFDPITLSLHVMHDDEIAAPICKVKELWNRFRQPGNRFLGSIKVSKYGL
jgi:hypothetical protein